MPRLTLRTLLAYIDDTLNPDETRSLGRKVAASEEAKQLVDRIKKVTRRRGLATPGVTDHDETADPNTVAAYLDNSLDSATVKHVEETCLTSDVHLAEVAACHQILTLVLTEPVRVPPRAHRRMYGLVESPASSPNHRPSNTLPIGGVAPPGAANGDADDADAALLLGMKRYSATTTWATRFALFGAAAVLLLLLAGGVLVSLPHKPPAPPETAAGHSSTLLVPAPVVTPPEPTPKNDTPAPPKAPDPVAVAPMPAPRPLDPSLLKPADPVVELGDPVPPPSDKREKIGRVDTDRVLVLTQREMGFWRRLRVQADDDEPIFSTDPVMALPGYKANVQVGDRNQHVEVHLWGNVPEQLPYRVFESRVIFHQPPDGFDADLTLLGGRIYLKSRKQDAERAPAGAKVRVRVAEEVWDVVLPDWKADVMVELISWYEPGTPYARAEGAQPKREARIAVVSGSAVFAAPDRFERPESMAKDTQRTWDSSSGTLTKPRPVANVQETARVPILDEFQRVITKLLSEMAGAVDNPNGARAVILGRLQPAAGVANQDLVERLAVYALAAMADASPDGVSLIKPLVDVLRSELPWEARQAVVTALVNWVARDRGNTAVLYEILLGKGLSEAEADNLLVLLRGFVTPFVSAAKPEAERLAQLVEKRGNDPSLLEDKQIAVREAALWNLLAVEQENWVPRPILVNVGAVGKQVSGEEYQKFVADWRKRVAEMEKRPPKKP